MIKYIVIFKPNTVNEAWVTQRVCLLTACIMLQIALKGFFLLEHEAFSLSHELKYLLYLHKVWREKAVKFTWKFGDDTVCFWSMMKWFVKKNQICFNRGLFISVLSSPGFQQILKLDEIYGFYLVNLGIIDENIVILICWCLRSRSSGNRLVRVCSFICLFL